MLVIRLESSCSRIKINEAIGSAVYEGLKSFPLEIDLSFIADDMGLTFYARVVSSCSGFDKYTTFDLMFQMESIASAYAATRNVKIRDLHLMF